MDIVFGRDKKYNYCLSLRLTVTTDKNDEI
jgi:hypothetical protein